MPMRSPRTERTALLGVLLVMLAACELDPGAGVAGAPGEPIPIPHTKTFEVYERDGIRIVDIEASVVTWGGAAGGPSQRARLVLVPRDTSPPPLTGDLAGATLIRTPVMRIAVNDQPHEAMVRALGIADRLVAVGGHNSYDDDIRARVRAGQIQQIGYGWHQPPILDALLASEPDVLLARMADLTHIQHIERVEALGVPVVPTFMDAELHYMGKVEWTLLLGMLTGREREAEGFVAEVSAEVERLERRAADQPRRSLLWAWYQSSGDAWSVTQRNAEAALIRAANAELVLAAPDDPELDGFSRLSTEQLLRDATHPDRWMIRDPLSEPCERTDLLHRFEAVREGCVFWQPGLRNPQADAWEVWEMGVIRPDWQLADIVEMVHPPLRDGTWRYLEPENLENPRVGTNAH
ncbi:MAG: ABC transporter substrate-binding protein [Holophagales bacterium]|nr:ABC transporter substrate-binding protein [Holophagales bacterium]